MRLDCRDGVPLHEGYFLSLRVVLAASVCSQGKNTPLHWAVANEHVEVAKVLLASGANVHGKDDVSGEGWGMRLDYRDGVPYMRGEVG